VFKVLTGKKITIPKTFKSKDGGRAIKCSLKANEGYLFPLERSFFFVHKPPTHIRFEDISSVDFLRVNTDSTNRTFDFGINLNNGNVVMFKSILREEYSGLFQFITSKQLTILNFKDLRPSSESDDISKGKKRSLRGSVAATRTRVRRAMQQEEILEDESDEDFGDGDGDLRGSTTKPSPTNLAEDDDVELDSAEIDSASDLEDFAKKPEGDGEEMSTGGKEEEDGNGEEDTEKNNIAAKDGDKKSKKRKRDSEAESPTNNSAAITVNNSTNISGNTTTIDKARPPKRIKVDQESQQGTAPTSGSTPSQDM